MGLLENKENDAHRNAVNKILGSELRKSFDPVVTSRLPERMKDLLQRFTERLEKRRLHDARKWW